MSLTNLFIKSTISSLSILLCMTCFSTSVAATLDDTEKEISNQPEKNCGEISVFFSPPKPKRYFASSIFNIDGNNVNADKKTHKLKPGKHIVSMFNHDGQLEKSTEAKHSRKSSGHRQSGKSFEIDIKPGITFHLAAEFISDKRYKKRNQEYWKPAVWKVTESPCQL